MARALKCDRCGKFYTYYDLVEGRTFNTIRLIALDDFGLKTGGDGVRFDLCEECCDDLAKFMFEK